MLSRLVAAAAMVLLIGCTPAPSTASDPTGQAPPAAGGQAADDRSPRRFTDQAGTTSEYRVFARGVRQPAGLLLFFHGDGAWEAEPARSGALGGASGIVEQARRRDFVTVLVRTPDTSSGTWWRNGPANAQWSAELMGELQRHHAIDRDRIWLVGYSGGAHFVARQLLPRHSQLIDGGGAVLFSGGGPPAGGTQLNPRLRDTFRMHFYVGADDTNTAGRLNSVTTAESGERWYAAAGIRTSHEFPPGVGHDLGDRPGPVLARQLDG
ncbi:hypothetical protein CGZ93_01895 [Enemella dayhoffiae]|uniref:Esterase n=1 Tax=Enemella dayhoffiae TaxID=2016507 RepID=A0A255HCW7_9ACTN|nr:hypothetical protein [Enemella dayhoffiae]OYO25226.1 hypothetical protein CGZ93_01895 [Enemella dayhoffiae]